MSKAQAYSATTTSADRTTKSLRILVAEDQSLLATDIAAMLEEMGHQPVGPVANGTDAIDLARREKPDLALLDINMPGRDGLSAGKVIYKEMDIPVVLLTAYSQAEQVRQAQAADAFGYLVKPASAQQMRAAIDLAYARYTQIKTDRAAANDLKRRLEERQVVERAKWLIVQKTGMAEPDALSLLQRNARSRQRTIGEVAGDILRTGVIPDGRTR